MLQDIHGDKEEVRELKSMVRTAFKQIQCFLMPRPDEKVEDDAYDGNFSGNKQYANILVFVILPSCAQTAMPHALFMNEGIGFSLIDLNFLRYQAFR